MTPPTLSRMCNLSTPSKTQCSACGKCAVRVENHNLRQTAQSLAERRKESNHRVRDLVQENEFLRDQLADMRAQLAFIPQEERKEAEREPVWVN